MMNYLKAFFGSTSLCSKVVTAGVLLGSSEVAAQVVNHKTSSSDQPFQLSWRRVGTTILYGSFLVAPVGHLYYPALENLSARLFASNFSRVGFQTAVNIGIYDPIDLGCYITYMGLANGKSFAQIKETMNKNFLPTLYAKTIISPAFYGFNYAFVPVHRRMTAACVYDIAENVAVSWIEQQEE